MKWSGSAVTLIHISKITGLRTKLGSPTAYNKALQDGVVESPAAVAGAAFNGAAVVAVTAANGLKKASKNELVVYQKVSLGDGKQANNPWLQELPDPITKATWDNYIMVSPQFGKTELGIDISDAHQADKYEVVMDKPLLNFTINKKAYKLPVLIVPGMQSNTLAIAIGYGRSEKSGRAANGVGQNAYPFLSFNGTTVDWSTADVSFEKWDGTKTPVAQTQTHSSYEGSVMR